MKNEDLISKARAETQHPGRSKLDAHLEEIFILRDEKHFTFKKIEEWLKANGVETSLPNVQRIYKTRKGKKNNLGF